MPAEEYNEKLRELVEENSLMFIKPLKRNCEIISQARFKTFLYEVKWLDLYLLFNYKVKNVNDFLFVTHLI